MFSKDSAGRPCRVVKGPWPLTPNAAHGEAGPHQHERHQKESDGAAGRRPDHLLRYRLLMPGARRRVIHGRGVVICVSELCASGRGNESRVNTAAQRTQATQRLAAPAAKRVAGPGFQGLSGFFMVFHGFSWCAPASARPGGWRTARRAVPIPIQHETLCLPRTQNDPPTDLLCPDRCVAARAVRGLRPKIILDKTAGAVQPARRVPASSRIAAIITIARHPGQDDAA